MVIDNAIVETEWIQYASGPWKSIWYVAYAQYILAIVLIITTSEFLGEERPFV